MQRFAGRVAFITGAAEGIGKAVARRILTEGGSVAVTDIDGFAAELTARELTVESGDADDGAGGRASGRTPGRVIGRVIGLGADVRDTASVDAAVHAAVTEFGRLDVLVNNVGIDYGGRFEDITEDTWNAQVNPTLYGAVRTIQAALPHLLQSDHAAVVAISSVNGMSAIGSEAYSAAKAGIINLMTNLAVRYSPVSLAARNADPHDTGARLPHGVRFNTVSPGTIHTGAWDRRGAAGADGLERMRRLYPMGRVGEPHDIAAAVAFLASSDASWITGINLPVEGGLLAGPTR